MEIKFQGLHFRSNIYKKMEHFLHKILEETLEKIDVFQLRRQVEVLRKKSHSSKNFDFCRKILFYY